VIPDVACVLTLGATTGMRRGELVVPRRDQFHPERGELLVDTAADLIGTKETKTGTERVVSLDAGTVDMLQRHIAHMDDRAAVSGVDIPADAYIFSLEIDCSKPMPPDHVT
jgi:integrase